MVASTMGSDLLIRPARGSILIAVSMLAAACSDRASDTPTTSGLSADLATTTANPSKTTPTSTSAPLSTVTSAGATFDSWIAALDGTPEGEAGTVDMDTEIWQLSW